MRHQCLYYVKARPEISDREYDRMFDELVALERRFPQLVNDNSPTKRIGSDLDNRFPEKQHEIPVLSLDKEYAVEGLKKWVHRIRKNIDEQLGFVVEEKIDGASIVLYYKNGSLETALTRGNGFFGNEVTENVRTIRQVPLMIDQPLDCAVRGEIYITKSNFETYNSALENRYSNPRNLAAGSLRNIKSSVVSAIPLNMLAYEGHFQKPEVEASHLDSHIEILRYLERLGFRISAHLGFFSWKKEGLDRLRDDFPGITTGDVSDMVDYVQEQISRREQLDYEIDGLVVKLNEIPFRDKLGHTSHHPRWSIAFKFDSPSGLTILKDVQIQVGRNGRVTPVAVLEPVRIGGSVVSRATLHNQEYIDILELGIGDTVGISRRGDVIPAVEKVIEKSRDNPSIYKIKPRCPFCDTTFTRNGAHHFCPNRSCPERKKRAIIYFAGKNQMDIESLGEKTIGLLFDKGFIHRIPDLYTFDYDRLLKEEGFKEKKIENIRKSLEVSKKKPYRTVLAALGFDGLGKNTVSDLIKSGYDSIDKIIRDAARGRVETFSSIPGFGEVTARLLIAHFTDKDKLKLIEELKKIGLHLQEKIQPPEESSRDFSGQTWVITGGFEHFVPREKAAREIEKRGGVVSHAISGKTTHLLCGSSPGSKLKKARERGVEIVDEKVFAEMLGDQ